MKPSRVVAAIAISAVCLAIFAALFWFLPHQNPRTRIVEPASLGGPDRNIANADASAVNRAPRSSAAKAPLPPIGAPLASIIKDLKRRALEGDAQAACRLAADLSTCASLARSRALRDMVDPVNAASSQQAPSRQGASMLDRDRRIERQIDIVARMDNSLESMGHTCEGIADSDMQDALKWLYRSASNGNISAMADFASGGWWRNPSSIRHPEVIARYEQEAQAMAEAAIAAGDRSLLSSYGLALSGLPQPFNRSPLSEVVKPDAVRARALLLLATRDSNGRAQSSDVEAYRNAGGSTPQLALATLTGSLNEAQIEESDRLAGRIGQTLMPMPQQRAIPWGIGQSDHSSLRAEDCGR